MKNYKQLKPTDKVKLLSYTYKEANGNELLPPGVYEVRELTEHVFKAGRWKLAPKTETASPPPSVKPPAPKQETLPN